MGITGNKNAGPFIPKYFNDQGQLVEMKKNKIYDLRAAIYQTGVTDPELREIKRQMITALEEAEKELLRGYLKTAHGVYEVRE